MATFNQQNQKVQYQYNADTINFGHAQSQEDFFSELNKLEAELEKAIQAKAITGEDAIDAETHVKKALLQAQEQTPNKISLIDHLTSAKELVTSVEGLATVFATAITTIAALF